MTIIGAFRDMIVGEMPEDRNFLSPATMSVLRSVENMSRYPTSRVCLFGKPDATVTCKIISEQFDCDRQRMIERWGFDILSESFCSDTSNAASPEDTKLRKALSEDKENIDVKVLVKNGGKTSAPGSPGLSESSNKQSHKNKLDTPSPRRKKSLKMTCERSHLRKARQSHVTGMFFLYSIF